MQVSRGRLARLVLQARKAHKALPEKLDPLVRRVTSALPGLKALPAQRAKPVLLVHRVLKVTRVRLAQ